MPAGRPPKFTSPEEMTNYQILEKAIKKAIEGGWHTDGMDFYDNDDRIFTYYSETVDPLLLIYNHDFAKALFGEYKPTQKESHYIPARGYPGEKIHKDKIVSKDDKDWTCTRCSLKRARCFERDCNLIEKGNLSWEYHLQNMVISDDPIEYLREYLEDL